MKNRNCFLKAIAGGKRRRSSATLATQIFLFAFFTAQVLVLPRKRLSATGDRTCSKILDHHLHTGSQDRRLKLIIEVSHGLGNRLRAISTGAALSHVTHRDLSIVWQRDVHLNASMDDLFQGGNVANWYSRSFMACVKQSHKFVVYDYLESPVDWRHRIPVDDTVDKHIYVRTVYKVLGKTKYDPILASEFLRSLQPSKQVDSYVDRIKQQLQLEKDIGITSAVGVHIRMQGNLEQDIPGVYNLDPSDPRYATPRMKAVAQVRHKCHYSQFVSKIKVRLKAHPTDSLYFITCDVPKAQAKIRQELGDAVFIPHLPEHNFCEGEMARSKYCIQLAFAEMLLLAQTKSFMFSIESSFSDIVVQLGSSFQEKLSGCA